MQTPPETLFFFGTLRDPDLRRIVLGEAAGASLLVQQARVRDTGIHRVAGDSFPILVPDPGEVAPGIVVRGVDEHAWSRILWYEDEDYGVETIVTHTADGRAVPAAVFTATERLLSSGEPWHYQSWTATDKPVDLHAAAAYMDLMGKVPLPEAMQRWTTIKATARATVDAAISGGVDLRRAFG